MMANQALVQKKSKDRVTRNADDGGREKLLAAARTCIRSSVQKEIRRQEIARFAGVTPALVTYYFHTRAELILAATRPVVSDALADVQNVLRSSGSFQPRLRQLVLLFIRFAAENSRILDQFVQACLEARDQESQNLVLETLGAMRHFFQSGAEAGEWRDFDPTFFIFAVWGMCKFVGEPPAFPVSIFPADVPDEQSWTLQADRIVELLINGIKAPSTPLVRNEQLQHQAPLQL